MNKPRFTDLDKYQRPYVPAEQSKQEGYLAKRFAEIRADQEKIAAEQKAKVAQMKKRQS